VKVPLWDWRKPPGVCRMVEFAQQPSFPTIWTSLHGKRRNHALGRIPPVYSHCGHFLFNGMGRIHRLQEESCRTTDVGEGMCPCWLGSGQEQSTSEYNAKEKHSGHDGRRGTVIYGLPACHLSIGFGFHV
jgi:hypothetical protein